MMKTPQFDIDLDKHYRATVVVACDDCGRESRHHLDSLRPDRTINCHCGADLGITHHTIAAAQQKAQAIKTAYHVS